MSLACHVLAWFLAPNLVLWAWVWLVPTLVVRVKRIHAGALGLALPGVVLLRSGVGEEVLRHEMQHIRQFRRYSPCGASVLLAWYYAVPALRVRRRTGCWPSFWSLWRSNPLEIEANRAMGESGPMPRHWIVGRGSSVR